jgi:phosphonate transport system ATP-binding protein
VARALYQQRKVFLGDEPTAGLDEVQAAQLLTLITRQHATTVLALHDVALALQHCTRIIGLQNGMIELDQPAQACSAALLHRFYCDA